MKKSSKNSSNKNNNNVELVCSFCGKGQREVQKIIHVGKLNKPICNECISICTQILDDSKS